MTPAFPDSVRRPILSGTRADALPTLHLEGVRLHAITEANCVDHVMKELSTGRGGSIVTMNLDHLRRFVHDETYARCTRNASIVTADGMPLLWASRIRRTPLPERVTGSNLIWSLSSAAARHGRSVFLLGGAPGTAGRTAEVLRATYPQLRIAGIFSHHIGPAPDKEALTDLRNALRAANPDIVYVALGSPKQEILIDTLRHLLPHAWWAGIGFAFSFASGAVPRAPLWMQKSGLEWLHRLAQEPRRLARRYLIDDAPFALQLLGNSIRERIASTTRR